MFSSGAIMLRGLAGILRDDPDFLLHFTGW
jgi:hypothetical protein